MKCIQHQEKKSAFTLAEVLITLTIIGIVAALTIPSLSAKYQKQQYVIKLKKVYTTLSNGFRQMIAVEGVDNFMETNFVLNGLPNCSASTVRNYRCEAAMKKYFKYEYKRYKMASEYTVRNYRGLNGIDLSGSGARFLTPEGALIYISVLQNLYDPPSTADISQIKQSGGTLYHNIAMIDIDVNGFSPPNIYGRDMFSFVLGQNGILYPNGGLDVALAGCIGIDPKECSWNTEGLDEACNDGGSGLMCAGRIIDEGWQMNY